MKIAKYFFAALLVGSALISCSTTDTDDELELIQSINELQAEGGDEGDISPPPPPPPPMGV